MMKKDMGTRDSEGDPQLANAIKYALGIEEDSILAKAKVPLKRKKLCPTLGFEIATTSGDIIKSDTLLTSSNEDTKPEPSKLDKLRRVKKQEVAARGRLKPSPLDREKERPLMKIATRGVVQLFNAVREQQKTIQRKLDEVGSSETKREKVLKSIDKKTFLDVLKGRPPISLINEETEIKTENEESEDEAKEEPSWSVLHDDFMMGAKLKDWEKTEGSSEPLEPIVNPKRSRKST